MVGKTISHYEITEKLGEGGMGVVYKARDTHLDRFVALKFLSSHLLESDEARERFVHEAKAAAALDHPNIGTVYEIGEADGQTFLAMAYIEGPTLKQKVDERPLKLKQAFDLAIQIGQGLQAAHDRGVIHRDIKPANLMLSADGQVKIMDFGLAHLGGRTKITKTGVVLGTPSYMAPEQLRGEQTDRRADIWSFGVVLHEMITGQPPFEGETEETLSYAILHNEPESLTALRSGVPVELDRVVAKLLAKDPDERYQHLDEALVDLRTLRKRLPDTTKARTTAVPVSTGVRHAWLPWGLLVATTIALLALAFVHFREKQPEVLLRKFALIPEQSLFITTYNTDVVLSPNGRHIAYHGGGALWVQDLDREQPRKMEAAGAAYELSWSPDSASIGYLGGKERGQLTSAPINGGSPKAVCDMPGEFWGASWSRDGEVIAFAAGSPPRLYQDPASGGAPKLIPLSAESDGTPGAPREPVYSPHFLPVEAGPRVLVYASGPQTEPVMMVLNTATGRRETLGRGALPWYSSSGHLVYQETGLTYVLWAVPFSLSALRTTGRPFRVAENGRYPTISDDGTMIYVQVDRPQRQLVLVNRQGQRTGGIGEPQRELAQHVLSPDGRFLAVVGGEDWNFRDVCVHEVGRGMRTRLTAAREGLYNVEVAAWSPSGDEIAYFVRDQGILARKVSGTEEARKLLAADRHVNSIDWSKDGQYILLAMREPGTGSDLSYLKRSEDGSSWAKHAFLRAPFNQTSAVLSPSGRFVAYVSNESWREEVYVRPFPEGDRQWLVSKNGGAAPRWTQQGKELLYVEPGGTLMAVSVSLAPEFSAGAASTLFRYQDLVPYDVSADGQRFILTEPVGKASPPVIRVVQNWFAEFQDRK